jgi:hypothetical protein
MWCILALMKLEVTEQGVVIPKNLLEGAKEVDVRKENKRIVLTPMPAEDPIFRIGKNPVKGGVTDASVNLDKYIYDGK